MPLFFYISGLLYKDKELNLFLAGKVKSLLIPVILFSMINVGLKCIFMLAQIEKLYDFLNFAGFWFVLTLLYIMIMHYILNVYIYKDRIRLLFAISTLSLIIGIYYSKAVQGKEVTIATTLVGYFFFMVGVVNQKTSICKKSICSFFGGWVLLCVTAILCKKNIPVMMYRSEYGNGLLFVLAAMCACLGLKMISEFISECFVLEWYGRNSLMILFTHFPVHRCVMKLLSYLPIDLIYKCTLGVVLVLILEIPIVLFINKFIPILKGDISKRLL